MTTPTPLTPAQLQMLEKVVLDIKTQFITNVANGNIVPEDDTPEELRECFVAFVSGWHFSWDTPLD